MSEHQSTPVCPKCKKSVRFEHCAICRRCIWPGNVPLGACWDCVRALGPLTAALMVVGHVNEMVDRSHHGPWKAGGNRDKRHLARIQAIWGPGMTPERAMQEIRDYERGKSA